MKRKPKKDKTTRPRCVCGQFADIYYRQSTKKWVEGSCRKCQEKAMEAELSPGGALRFLDDFEVEYEVVEVTETYCEVAEYTGRARRMVVDGEALWIAIFKVPMSDGSFEWYGQPIPWEE